MNTAPLFDLPPRPWSKIDDGISLSGSGHFLKYDNENSYTSQMVRTIKYFAEL